MIMCGVVSIILFKFAEFLLENQYDLLFTIYNYETIYVRHFCNKDF
jgi:hypothetical protein